ncbi:MAG: MBL fold metallo-hydrolase [Candidatus Dormibacteria bacterium]
MGAPSWTETGAGVFVRHHEHLHLNVGLIVGADEVMVIDTRSWASQARELQMAIRELTDLPIRHVVNTHGHFDHCFGNEVFVDADIWGHVGCAVELREYGEIQRRAMMGLMPEHRRDLEAVRICLPTRLIDETAEVRVGGRSVLLRFFGRAHTDHDLCVVVPDADTIFAGDVFEQSAPPSFHDAWPLEWGRSAGRIVELGTSQIVPGHGKVMTLDATRQQSAELVLMGELCAEVVAGNLSTAGAIGAAPFPKEWATVAVDRGLVTTRS